jgi:hypothetical protein
VGVEEKFANERDAIAGIIQQAEGENGRRKGTFG